jgi:hypothetical protein
MSTPQSILEQMGQIQDMERGKLCPMQAGRYFNHQTWEQGRNVVRYVPAARLPALKRSIAGYQRFLVLVEQYIALVVRQSRQRRTALLQATAPIPSSHYSNSQTKKRQKKAK